MKQNYYKYDQTQRMLLIYLKDIYGVILNYLNENTLKIIFDESLLKDNLEIAMWIYDILGEVVFENINNLDKKLFSNSIKDWLKEFGFIYEESPKIILDNIEWND